MKRFSFLLLAAVVLVGVWWISQADRPAPTPASNSSLEVAFLDVGQGDAILVRNSGASMLVDAGTNASTPDFLRELRERGVGRFDFVVATHPHEDHVGGMDAVVEGFEIGHLLMPKLSTTTNTFADLMRAIQEKGLTVTAPEPGASYDLGASRFTILAPGNASYEDLNDYSIVLRISCGNNSVLLTGDAGLPSEKEMLAGGYSLKSDVLKVGHHGSVLSTSPEFLPAVRPSFAVISVGQGNDYGHPHRETLDELNAAGVTTYRTDLHGTITLLSDGNHISFTTAR